MNGTFAIMTLVLGMTDAFSDCTQDCLARAEVPARMSVSGGTLLFQGNDIGQEIYLRYDSTRANGPYRLVYGASYSSLGDVWVGAGHAYQMSSQETGLYAELHAMTGLYFRDRGPDLGLPLEFRSGLELGWESKSGWRLAASFDHRSNADISAVNPGIETLTFRVSKALN